MFLSSMSFLVFVVATSIVFHTFPPPPTISQLIAMMIRSPVAIPNVAPGWIVFANVRPTKPPRKVPKIPSTL